MTPAYTVTSPDVAALGAMLQNDANTLRDVASMLLRRWRWIAKIGADGLQGPPWNMAPDDAAELVRLFNLVATPALVYYGEVAQPEEYNFDDALTLTRGPN